MLNKEFWVLKPSSINWSRCTRIHSGSASTAGVQPFDDVYQGHRFSLLKTQSLIFVLGIYLDRCFKTVLYFTCITTAEWEWSSFNDQSTQDANALCDITSHVKCTATHKYWLGLFENIARITFVEDNVWSKGIHLPRMAYFVLRCPSIMILLKMRNLYKKTMTVAKYDVHFICSSRHARNTDWNTNSDRTLDFANPHVSGFKFAHVGSSPNSLNRQ